VETTNGKVKNVPSPGTCHGRWMSPEYEPGLVSVIIPTYNRAHLVTDAMDSVWAQTYRPIELIVVDDGSTDNTREVVERWGEEHSGDPQFELRYFYQENRGAPAARNLGLIESKGEFIQFLDSDDLLVEHKIRLQLTALAKHDYAWCKSQIQDDTGITRTKPRYHLQLSTWLTPHAFIAAHMWHTHSFLGRRKVCVSVGPWNENLTGCQEYEYFARVKAFNFNGIRVDNPLVLVREHPGPRVSQVKDLSYCRAGLEADSLVARLLDSSAIMERDEQNRIALDLCAIAAAFARQGSRTEARECLRRAQTLSKGPLRAPLLLASWLALFVSPSAFLEPSRWFWHFIRGIVRHHDGCAPDDGIADSSNTYNGHKSPRFPPARRQRTV